MIPDVPAETVATTDPSHPMRDPAMQLFELAVATVAVLAAALLALAR